MRIHCIAARGQRLAARVRSLASRVGPALLPALLAAPLVSGCNGAGATAPAGGLNLPDCQNGQVLGYDASNQLVCLGPPNTNLRVENCQAGEALTSETGAAVLCVPTAGMGTEAMTLTRINTATQSVLNAESTLSLLKTAFRGNPSYVGVTTTTTTGAISVQGSDKGIASATAMCNAQYPESHMCTAYEMAVAAGADAANGGLSGKTVAKSWIYMPSWNTPLAGATDPLQGEADNCGQYTYGGTNLNWSGIAVDYGLTVISTGFNALRFHGSTEAPCDQPLPVACCK